MRALVQRIRWAEAEADGRVVARIGPGLLVYLGIAHTDEQADAEWLAEKIANLRIFEDDDGKLNISVRDARGGVLAVSNFTLMGDASKGRRPAFTAAAPGQAAEPLYQAFLAASAQADCQVDGGAFGAKMVIRSAADGPVNLVIDSRSRGDPKACSK